MSELRFELLDASAKERAASPAVCFRIRVTCEGEAIEALVLRAQARIEPQWRHYSGEEQELLGDLFGTPDRWDQTLRSFSWADVPFVVGAFEGEIEAELCLPCSWDFEVAAARFFSALSAEGGKIPVRMFFSGSIFRRGGSGLSSERVAWSSECSYALPVDVWREAIAACYGDARLLRVERETLEALARFRARAGAGSWDEAIARLLEAGEDREQHGELQPSGAAQAGVVS